MIASSDLQPALALIAGTDPATRAAMEASPWQVSTSYDVITPMADWYREEVTMEYSLASALGVTRTNLTPDDGVPGNPPQTFINLPLIRRAAHREHVPVTDLIADVLVHEFVHTTQAGVDSLAFERPAFQAGITFARKLPAPYGKRLAYLSVSTYAQLAEEER